MKGLNKPFMWHRTPKNNNELLLTNKSVLNDTKAVNNLNKKTKNKKKTITITNET